MDSANAVHPRGPGRPLLRRPRRRHRRSSRAAGATTSDLTNDTANGRHPPTLRDAPRRLRRRPRPRHPRGGRLYGGGLGGGDDIDASPSPPTRPPGLGATAAKTGDPVAGCTPATATTPWWARRFDDVIDGGRGDDTVTGGDGPTASSTHGGNDTLVEAFDRDFFLCDDLLVVGRWPAGRRHRLRLRRSPRTSTGSSRSAELTGGAAPTRSWSETSTACSASRARVRSVAGWTGDLTIRPGRRRPGRRRDPRLRAARVHVDRRAPAPTAWWSHGTSLREDVVVGRTSRPRPRSPRPSGRPTRPPADRDRPRRARAGDDPTFGGGDRILVRAINGRAHHRHRRRRRQGRGRQPTPASATLVDGPNGRHRQHRRHARPRSTAAMVLDRRRRHATPCGSTTRPTTATTPAR